MRVLGHCGPLQHGVDDVGEELVPVLHVLGVLLGLDRVVGVEQGELGQRAGGGVGEEFVDLHEVVGDGGLAEQWEVDARP